MTTTITFYGGVNEIGGNKVLLTDEDTKIFLDFGMSFTLKNKYFSAPFLSPKNETSLLELGILPEIKGIYKFKEKEKQEIDAIFLSHSHMDHVAHISFLKRSIPIYCGETTKILLEALSTLTAGDFEFNLEGIQFQTFRTGDKVQVGSVEIEPVHVDHSVPGAYGFIIHTTSGTVVYTGDFRRHGTKPEMTEEFIQKAEQAKPVAVISEGTNMTGVTVSSEPEVEKKLSEIIRQTSGLVLADFAKADVDRLRSFYKAAKRNTRHLAISLKQAWLLKELRSDSRLKIPNLNDEAITIFQKEKRRYYKWEKELFERYEDKIVDSSNIAAAQEKFVLVLPFYGLEELTEIKPSPGSCHILSASEPFNEEMRIDYEKLVNWLTHYGVPQYQIHTSGHIMPLQLKNTLKSIKAKKIFPIHTEHFELFRKLMSDLDSKVMAVEKGKKYVV